MSYPATCKGKACNWYESFNNSLNINSGAFIVSLHVKDYDSGSVMLKFFPLLNTAGSGCRNQNNERKHPPNR